MCSTRPLDVDNASKLVKNRKFLVMSLTQCPIGSQIPASPQSFPTRYRCKFPNQVSVTAGRAFPPPLRCVMHLSFLLHCPWISDPGVREPHVSIGRCHYNMRGIQFCSDVTAEPKQVAPVATSIPSAPSTPDFLPWSGPAECPTHLSACLPMFTCRIRVLPQFAGLVWWQQHIRQTSIKCPSLLVQVLI